MQSSIRLTDVFSPEFIRSLRKESSRRLVAAFKLSEPGELPERVILRMNRLARLRLTVDPNDEDSAELKFLTDPCGRRPSDA